MRDVRRSLARALGMGGLPVLEQRTAACAGDAQAVMFEFLHDSETHGIVLGLRASLDLEVLAALALTPVLVRHDSPHSWVEMWLSSGRCHRNWWTKSTETGLIAGSWTPALITRWVI